MRRKPQLLVLLLGLVLLATGAGLLPGIGAWVALAMAAVCVAGGLTAFFPDLGYVRLSPDGLTVRYVLLPARTVPWRDVAAVTSEGIRQIRHTVPCLVVAYRPGYGGKKLGQRLRDGRSAVGNFTTASGDELAARAREYLARYGG